MLVTVILAVAGLLIGFAFGFMAAARQWRNKFEEVKNKAAVTETQLIAAKTNHEAMLKQVEQKDAQLRDAMEERHNLALASQEQRHKEAVESMNARFEETIGKMREEVTNVTRQLLDERQKEFSASSRESLSHLMEPLQENIRKMSDAVRDNTIKNTQYSGQLKEGIENVLKQSQETMKSADRLSNVLSSSNKIQGNFGERILTELLESSGLKEGIHYDTQETIRDKSGVAILDDNRHQRRPDVILHIDKGHHVIIDSKVSLTAFYAYMEADNEQDRARFLKEHLDSLRKQVKNLADKDYSLHLNGAIDYVIMFVPITNALYTATQEDPKLWREAMDRKVYIADEQTLFAALKIISINWRQQAQAENQQEVYRLAGEMLKRVQQFADKFSAIGTCLKKAQTEYDNAVKKLSEGGQSIPQTCNKLIKLGAPYDKKAGILSDLLDE